MLLRHVVCRALSRAWANTGNRIAARMAIIAITTSNSISVKPFRLQPLSMGLSDLQRAKSHGFCKPTRKPRARLGETLSTLAAYVRFHHGTAILLVHQGHRALELR